MTTAEIGMLDNNGKITTVFLNSGGMTWDAGKILVSHYTNLSKLKELMKLGVYGISQLGRDIGESNTFSNTNPDVCLFYGRDLGEKKRKKIGRYSNLEDFQNSHDGDYGYVFNPKTKLWVAFKGTKETHLDNRNKMSESRFKYSFSEKNNNNKDMKLRQIIREELAKVLKERSSYNGDVVYNITDTAGDNIKITELPNGVLYVYKNDKKSSWGAVKSKIKPSLRTEIDEYIKGTKENNKDKK